MVKEIKFDELLECLVTYEGKKYEGKRFKTISATTTNHSDRESARSGIKFNIENLAILANADAYEIISTHYIDSQQEYDRTPYTASAIALLYKI